MLLCSKSKNSTFLPPFSLRYHIFPFSPAHFCHLIDDISVSILIQGSPPSPYITFTQSDPRRHSAKSLPFSQSSYFWLNQTTCFLSQLSYKCSNSVLPSTTAGWKISPHLHQERRRRPNRTHMFLSTWKDWVLDCAWTTVSTSGTYLEKEGMSAHP